MEGVKGSGIRVKRWHLLSTMWSSNGDEKREVLREDDEPEAEGVKVAWEAGRDSREIRGGGRGWRAVVKRLLMEGGGGLLLHVIMASLTKYACESLPKCELDSLAGSLARVPIGCVTLEIESAAKNLAGESEEGGTSEQLNQRMSRAVPLES
jgi:hypothetical protein